MSFWKLEPPLIEEYYMNYLPLFIALNASPTKSKKVKTILKINVFQPFLSFILRFSFLFNLSYVLR